MREVPKRRVFPSVPGRTDGLQGSPAHSAHTRWALPVCVHPRDPANTREKVVVGQLRPREVEGLAHRPTASEPDLNSGLSVSSTLSPSTRSCPQTQQSSTQAEGGP